MKSINTHEIEIAMEKYGDIVITRDPKNQIIIMSIKDYQEKKMKEDTTNKLKKAEEEIENEETYKAEDVFKELKEKSLF